MKYNNNSAKSKPLGRGEFLHFVQQFWFWNDLIGIMLYFVQDFNRLPYAQLHKFMEWGTSYG